MMRIERHNSGRARLLKNSAIGLARVAVSSVISVLSLPFLLRVLGIEGFGAFVAISGMIGVIGFLPGTLGLGVQRKFSLLIGTGSFEKLTHYLRNSIYFHLIVGGLLLTVLAATSPYLIKFCSGATNLDPLSVRLVFIGLVIVMLQNFLVIPFSSLLLANEAISTTAKIELLGAVLGFGVVLLLPFFSGDKLVLYVSGLAVANSLTSLAYMFKARTFIEFPMLGFGRWDNSVMNDITKFGAWNSIGALAAIGRTHGISLLLGAHFGVSLTAAFGVALRFANFFSSMTTTLRNAAMAQIVKSEGAGQRLESFRIAAYSSRLSFLLTMVWLLPVLSKMNDLLLLWLDTPPPSAAFISRMILIVLVIDLSTVGFMSSIQAMGRIARYQIVVGGLMILHIPLGAAIFGFGLSFSYLFWLLLLLIVMAVAARMIFMKRIGAFDVAAWLQCDFRLSVAGIMIGCFAAWLGSYIPASNWLVLGLHSVLIGLIALTGAIVWGLDFEERKELLFQIKGKLASKL